MKTYRGTRDQYGNTHVTVDKRPLNHRLDLRSHSPTGLEWGYGGSGPAQLALAILCEHFKDEPGADESASELYQEFKFRVVAGLPHDGWTLNSEEINAALAQIVHDKETKLGETLKARIAERIHNETRN